MSFPRRRESRNARNTLKNLDSRLRGNDEVSSFFEFRHVLLRSYKIALQRIGPRGLEMTISDVLAPWAVINAALGLDAPIRDEVQYTELMAFVNESLERFSNDDAHPVFVLVDLVANRIREFEARQHPLLGISTQATWLAFLMEPHGLRPSDLPEVGAQSVVSAVLAGKRALKLRQMTALADRFGVPMDALA